MTLFRRIAAACSATLLIVAAACAHRGASPSGNADIRDTEASTAMRGSPVIRMLLVNDVYVADTLRDGSGGLARVAYVRDSIERATNSRVYFVLAGDVLSPSVLGKWYGGAQMVDAFNAARLDLAVFGNHEFDGNRANLLARVAQSKFQWLSGNCTENDGRAFGSARGWDTVSIEGVRIGFFGTTIVRDYPAYVRCTDADRATTALVDTLQRVNAALIVGVTHRNFYEDTTTLIAEPRITAILGGHDHNGRRFAQGNRVLTKALSNGRSASLVTFSRTSGGVWRATAVDIPITSRLAFDPRTQAVVARWRDSLTSRIGPDRVLGVAPEAINAIDSISRRESRFGNMIVDGMRAGTHSDVALINSGALRFDDMMAAGPITRHMIEGVFLFADETRAVTFTLTGARLRELLEHGVAQGSLGGGPYLQVSGVHFAFDARQPSGGRIVGPLTRDDGRIIAPTDSLGVTFVAYPSCRKGDGYVIPEAAEACEFADDPLKSPRTVDLVIAHLEAMGGRIVAPPTGRVTRLDR